MEDLEIHLVEPLGRGGIHQHAVEVARRLALAGNRVVFHTATDAELSLDSVRWCQCVDWHRHRRFRRTRILTSYLTRTVPHLHAALRRGGVVHLQGPFKPALVALTIAILSQRARVVYSPHNTFSRKGRRSEEQLIRWCIRRSDASVVFSDWDAARVEAWSDGLVVRSDLVQFVPESALSVRDVWRSRWGARKVVLFAGQIRKDKRLDLLIRAMERLGPTARLAVVGEDLGDASRCRQIADETGIDVHWSLGYVNLNEFVAAVAEADVVACPYQVNSQSGVLALAALTGTTTVATDAGGLAEIADFVAATEDPSDIARAINEALAVSSRPRAWGVTSVAEHLYAYGVARPIDSPASARKAGHLTGRDIILLASAPFDASTRVNCHHIAERLAAGNRVLYVDSIGGRSLATSDFSAVLRRLLAFTRGARRVAAQTWRLAPLVIPNHSSALVSRLNASLLRGQVWFAAKWLGFDDAIIWMFNPRMKPAVLRGASALIYHCVDRYEANERTNERAARAADNAAVEVADLVFVTSRPLFEERKQRARKIVLAENVADFAAFSDASATSEFAELPRPVIGYVGNLAANKVDIELLAQIAEAREDWTLLLVGPAGIGDPSTDLRRLRELSNVHLVGPRPYTALPSVVAAMDVCLIPFRDSPLTNASLPMKFFEYLAAGKPVVGTPLEALEPHAPYFAKATTAGEFVQAISAALSADDEGLRLSRVRYAEANSWEKRFDQLETEVRSVLLENSRSRG